MSNSNCLDYLFQIHVEKAMYRVVPILAMICVTVIVPCHTNVLMKNSVRALIPVEKTTQNVRLGKLFVMLLPVSKHLSVHVLLQMVLS